jgi:peptidoglycan/xylan/chitin deacetylase (PgdA/CDA1 family)
MENIISLMYHDVFEKSVLESGFQNIGALKYKISRPAFEDQIKTIVTFCEEKRYKKDNVCLTFDDGGKSFLTVIAPVLEKHGLKGYFFITTKLIDTAGFLTAEDIIELDKRGHFIGTHSHSHPANISLLSDKEIENEWVDSIDIIRGILQGNILCASIPGGFVSSKSEKILFSNGINLIFTSNPTTSIRYFGERKILGRYSVTQSMVTEDVENLLKPFSLIRNKQYIKWTILKILKQVFGKYYFNLREKLLQTI